MLYIKENNKLIPIDEEHLYTKCYICGKEIPFNDFWVTDEDFFDFLFNQAHISCGDCAKNLKEPEPTEINTDHDRIVRLTHMINEHWFKKTCFNE